jgi:hypothetical protein
METRHSIQLAEVTANLSDYKKLGETLLPLAQNLREEIQSTRNKLLENNSQEQSPKDQTSSFAILESMQIDTDKTYIQNIQRILDTMRYDKIEAYKHAKIIRCSDGFVFVDENDFDITDDTGMCYELACKAATWLKIMYPENHYLIAEDKRRPSGWNHFYIIDSTKSLIIDPSKNKIGKLDETGKWDSTNVNYCTSGIRGIHSHRHIKKHIESITKKKDGKNKTYHKALISPRHFGIESDIQPFGTSLVFRTEFDKPFLYLIKNNQNKKILYQLEENTDPEEMQTWLREKEFEVPLEILQRIVDMWKTICQKGNFKTVPFTVDEYQKLQQEWIEKLNLLKQTPQ